MMFKLKGLGLAMILLAIIAIMAITALSSCRSVNKNSRSQTEQHDTAAVSKSNSGTIVKSHSTGVKEAAQVNVKEEGSTASDEVEVKFKGDSAESDKPVTIKKNPDGSITVDPGGRQLESVKTKNQQEKNSRDSTGSTNKETSAIGKSDSSYHNISDSSGGKQLVIQNENTVQRQPDYRWIWWVSGAFFFLFLLVAGGVYLYIKVKRRVIELPTKKL